MQRPVVGQEDMRQNMAGIKEERPEAGAEPAALCDERKKAVERLHAAVSSFLEDLNADSLETLDALLWETLCLFQSFPFFTAKKLEFTYTIKGNEMFVSRKEKSETRATVNLAFHKALSLQKSGCRITGPKMLGTFGASYLYPVFKRIGVIVEV